MLIQLTKETLREFQRHQAQWLAAAIAYYALFAVAPLIIVIVEFVGFFLGQHQDAANRLYEYLSTTAGSAAAGGIRSIVTTTMSQQKAGIVSQVVGWAVFVVGAIGLFGSLQAALNTIWDVVPAKRGVLQTIKDRLFSFGLVLAVAFLLLISLGVNSVLTAAAPALMQVFPAFPTLVKVLEFIVTWTLITTLFALMFEFLPECRIEWRDVWLGAAISATLFLIGQFLLGWYLGRPAVSSGYGAFGGVVIFLIWVNYSAQIVLFGAEFTHVYARARSKEA